jgi:hypothetical protein
MGENTMFFLSGQSYYQVLWTNPRGGNAYYILAHAFIAAQMNGLAGATPPTTEMANATTFFNTYTPSTSLTRAVRNQAISWASTLDSFNNGLVSYAHCN